MVRRMPSALYYTFRESNSSGANAKLFSNLLCQRQEGTDVLAKPRIHQFVFVIERREGGLVTRRILKIATLALAHFLAYIFCTLKEFNTNALFPFTLKPSAGHATWLFLMRLLEFPFVTVANTINGVPDEIMLLIFILNSLLWGTIIYYALSRLRWRRLMTVSF